MSQKFKTATDLLCERAKRDLILLPKGLRIFIDLTLSLTFFLAFVAYPIVRSVLGGTFCMIDVGFIGFGLVMSGLFLLFVTKQRGDRK